MDQARGAEPAAGPALERWGIEPAGDRAYGLTALGRDMEPLVLALGRVGRIRIESKKGVARSLLRALGVAE